MKETKNSDELVQKKRSISCPKGKTGTVPLGYTGYISDPKERLRTDLRVRRKI